MKEFTLRLKSKSEIYQNTVAFVFDIEETDYNFEAGQYAYFTIPNPASPDKKGHSRPFSIASSPNNKKELMIVARKNSSIFVGNLLEVKPGTNILVSKAFGSLKIENDAYDKVFISGGTGIAPVRSIIEKEIERGLKYRIYIFHLSREPGQFVFFDEFKKWDSENSHLKFIPVIRDVSEDSGGYESGEISKELLEKYLDDLSNKIFYVTGPDQMVESVKKILEQAGVKKKNIKTEKM